MAAQYRLEDSPVSLELSYFPGRKEAVRTSKRVSTKQFRDQKILQSQGMAVTVSSRKAGFLGAHPSRELLYSFSYKGIGDAFARHHGAFEATLRSLVLQ